jgi:Zn-dependent peptidase ImmA (M78 family)
VAFPHYAAEQVLEDLAITGPEDLQLLDAIAWKRGATVLYKPLQGSEARLVVAVGRRAIITISNRIEDLHRRRFGVAHELGHLEMHRQHSNVFLCSSQDINDWKEGKVDANLEQEANEFAAALLLPERFFAPLCKGGSPTLDFISELAEAFSVSLTATALRYLRVCDEICAVVFSQAGYIRWFRGSQGFERDREDLGLFIDVRSKLDPSSLAASFFQGRTVPITPKRVRASVWFEPGRYRSDATVIEQSWTMPQYDAVLTLLWVDDDIEDDNDSWLDYD